jgi:uncharacterized protein (DUF2235 family)
LRLWIFVSLFQALSTSTLIYHIHSRGAHTARAVVAMINTVGLLPAHNEEHIPFAFSCYKKSTTPEGTQMSADFRETFSEKIRIHFVGLWCGLIYLSVRYPAYVWQRDTVNSTGALWPRVLPGTDDNPACKYFRHALSLDERRVRFKPTVHHAAGDKRDRDGVPKVKQVWFAGDHCGTSSPHHPHSYSDRVH